MRGIVKKLRLIDFGQCEGANGCPSNLYIGARYFAFEESKAHLRVYAPRKFCGKVA